MKARNLRIRIIVSGRVQGVFFRYSAKDEAEKLNLTGYAKNLRSGEVEIVAEGEKENLIKLLGWARAGPKFASVNKVEHGFDKATNDLLGFEIL